MQGPLGHAQPRVGPLNGANKSACSCSSTGSTAGASVRAAALPGRALGASIARSAASRRLSYGKLPSWITHAAPEGPRDPFKRSWLSNSLHLFKGLDYGLLKEEELLRLDNTDDSIFYQRPRFVQHEGSAYLERLRALYADALEEDWAVLDLCASWDSHLPRDLGLRYVMGHGMNGAELKANGALDSYFVQDLNVEPKLPCRNAEFDAVLCSLGFQYLTRPLDVCRELRRVLVPGGKVLITFGQHCFTEKATAGWLARSNEQRMQLVSRYLEAAGFEDTRVSQVRVPAPPSPAPEPSVDRDPKTVIPVPRSDVLCVAVAHRPGLPSSRTLMREDGLQEVGYVSPSNSVLHELELRDLGAAKGAAAAVSASTLKMWVASFAAMREEAVVMGIPESAVPELPPQPSAEDIREKRKELSNIMASFLSAGL